MKLLHIHNEVENRGGTEIYLHQLQELLPELGHETYWVAIQQDAKGWRWCVRGEKWQHSDKMFLIESLRAWVIENDMQLLCIHNLFDSMIVDSLVQLKPTIKFSHSPVVVCPGKDKYWRHSDTACTKPYGLHCFFHAYSEGCTNRHPKRLLQAFNFVREEIERAKSKYHRTIVMSSYNADRLEECGIPSGKVVVNPYFTSFTPESTQRPPQDSLNLLFIGRIIKGKGVEHLIRSVEKLLNERKDVTLDIIGDGLLLNDIKQLVKEKQLERSVTFHGWLSRNEIDAYLQSCLLLIFPSTYPESFGIVGIEAMMAGKPVVAFNVGGVSTWLENNETGFLCAPGDVVQMEQAIRRLVEQPELHARMSRNARSSAIRNFLPRRHLQILDEVFNDAVNAGTKQMYS